nr:MAG: hypothetical protein [Totiviridae sp.]
MPGSPLRSVMIGYYAATEGNGTTATLRHRNWGPPYIAVSAIAGIGTVLKKSMYHEALLNAQARNPDGAIGSRPDVMDSGYLKTYLDQVARGATAQPTSMAMAFLKLGLLHQWANFASGHPDMNVVLAGQAQIHEPTVTFERDSTVRRLVNASGLCLEDCGGTCQPAFPFLRGHQQGSISFYADPQVPVAHGQTPFHVPWSILGTGDMSLVAAYVLLFAPWPCGNLSLAIKSRTSSVDRGHIQTYSWYGTTLALPGELDLCVTFPRDTTADLRPNATSKWPIPLQPTMGPTPVRHYAPYAPLPVVYRVGDIVPRVRLVDFCVSWINGIAADTVANLAAILCHAGLCDQVDRWAVDGLTLFSNHSGLMAVGPVTPTITESVPIDPPTNFENRSQDPVPLLMRCWRDVGDRLDHIPPEVDWTDWKPHGEWTLPQPDVRTVGLIVLGLYEFERANRDTVVHTLLGSPYVSAAVFTAAQRRFIAWHHAHAEARASYELYERAAAATTAGSAECRLFSNMFGVSVYQPGRFTRLISCALQAVQSAPPLTVSEGMVATSFLRRPRRWESNTWDLTNASPLKKIVVGSMPDSVMYTWSRTVPQEEMPFVITTLAEGGTRALQDIKAGIFPPPREYDGPYLEMRHYERCLQLNDLAEPTCNDYFMNRLMHFVPEYFLAEFHTGLPATSAPPPGYAPIPLTRRADSWRRVPGVNMTEISATYPNVCTTWMAWTDPTRHQVTALLARHRNNFWRDLLRRGIGGQSAGAVYEDQAPALSSYRPLTAEGPALREKENIWSGNGNEDAAETEGRTGSQTVSSTKPSPAPQPTLTTAGHQLDGTPASNGGAATP